MADGYYNRNTKKPRFRQESKKFITTYVKRDDDFDYTTDNNENKKSEN